jgi:hypothetical protein
MRIGDRTVCFTGEESRNLKRRDAGYEISKVLPKCMFDWAQDRLAPAVACRTIQSCAPLGYRRLD